MAQSANSSLSGRELALERRKAMSSGGKAALGNAAPQAAASAPSATAALGAQRLSRLLLLHLAVLVKPHWHVVKLCLRAVNQP